LFAGGDARSRRVFMSQAEPLSAAERRCVSDRLVGVSGGGAPDARRIVELRLRLRPDGTNDVRAALTE
jgi:hypothetical protein